MSQTPQKVALVSGADANYFPLLLEWLHSIRRFPASAAVDICILDTGLTPEQVKRLHGLGIKEIARPDWPAKVPPRKVRGKDYLKSCVCRPFIPKIFPGYDVYMWMDSDTWVQNWEAVDMFIAGALKNPDKIVITSTGADRHAQRSVRIKWLWRWPYRVASFYFGNGRRAFGFNAAKKLASQYVLSAGCFALSGQARHWRRWQELVRHAMVKGDIFPAEQLSLGVLVHIEGFRAELLPAYTHWICETRPMWNTAQQQFVEPFMPHERLGILHLSGVDAMRGDRAATTAYETETGDTVQMNCRYPFFDGGPVMRPQRA